GERIKIDSVWPPVDRKIDALDVKRSGLRRGLIHRLWGCEHQCRGAGRLQEATAGCHRLKLEQIVHCHASACVRVRLRPIASYRRALGADIAPAGGPASRRYVESASRAA